MPLFTWILIFFDKYLIPLLFAIGLLCFIYGIIEYFIIGEGGDEERAHHGRELFLQAIGWFSTALIFFGIYSAFAWITQFSFDPGQPPQGGGGVDFNQNKDVLKVPNVPTR